tara:strand:+ start:2115 stop:2297 length:183 start_codon:yes stop_codon:yes gene_type:complete
MQLKYNRKQSIGGSVARILLKIVIVLLLLIIGIFLIEKITFPSPEQKFKIDITNEIKKLK